MSNSICKQKHRRLQTVKIKNKIRMNSLCRLCADCKDYSELKTDITELESKLVLCCGWFSSVNEVRMPSKACDACVEEVERCWRFAESVKAAENKLNKLIGEQIQEFVSNDDVSLFDSVKVDQNYILDPCDVQTNESELLEVPTKYLDGESSHSFENTSKITSRKTVHKEKPEAILTRLDDVDRLVDGTISWHGVSKLEEIFPEMKSMSWNECEYKCNKCNRIFKGPHNFFAHNRSIHFDEVLKMVLNCVYCGSKHRREYTLSQHMATTHFPHLKYRCWYCADYFWDNQKLIEHRNLHTNIEYKCEMCNQICMSRDILYSHVAQMHLNKRWIPDPETKFICDICRREFTTKNGIKSHMLRHTNKLDYVCDQCGKKFLKSGYLRSHVETTHSNVRNFICQQCDKRFKTKRQMMNHSKRHDNIKTFACEKCDKRFRQAFELARHMRCHNDIFTYTYKFCPRQFKHHSGLRTHQRTHTSDKPYSCPVCEYRSTNRSNLKKHSMRIHSVDLGQCLPTQQ